MWERNFEVTFCIFPVSVTQINGLEVIQISICFKISLIKNVKIVIIYTFKSKLPIFGLYQKNTPTICLSLSAGISQIESRTPSTESIL